MTTLHLTHLSLIAQVKGQTITTHEWRKYTMKGTMEVFAMPLCIDWQGLDTECDTWLLSNDELRK